MASLRSRLAALTSYDVFPEFSAKVRRLIYNPLGVLTLAALASLLCGLFLHPQGFALAGGLLVVILLGLAWPWLTLRGLSGTLAFDRARVVEGEPVTVSLHVRNRWPWSAWGLAVRHGFGPVPLPDPATRPIETRGLPPSVPPVAGIASAPRRRSIRCSWSFVPGCRGVYPDAPVLLTTGFPFGIREYSRTLHVEGRLLVWPLTVPVGPVPPTGGERLAEGSVSRNKVGSNGDVLGVRPYRRGDSPRRIHWGQSARHDRLIVCELQTNSRPVMQLVLDVASNSHQGTGRDSSREWAIRVAASLAKGWLEEGAQIGLVCGRWVVPAASGLSQLQRIMDILAQVPPTASGLAHAPPHRDHPDHPDHPDHSAPPDQPSLADLLNRPECRSFREGLQIIITTDRAAATLTGLAPDPAQRWLILRAEGFSGGAGAQAGAGVAAAAATGDGRSRVGELLHLPMRPWLVIESADQVPSQLRGAWSEALHGS
jgi:uncharacterized protein (DUF58 family)